MKNFLNEIMNFHNKQVDSSIINGEQIKKLVEYLLDAIENDIDGDVVELGCYVGESSKYLMKTLIETNSDKKLYVYDSFEGLPDLSKWEINTGWRPRTLVTSEDVLTSNFIENNLPPPIITKGWFCDIPNDRLPEKISFAFLDGDFYDSIYDSLVKVYDRVVDGGYIFFHDYKRNDLPGVEAAIKDFFELRGIENNVIEVVTQVGGYKKNSIIVKNDVVKVETTKSNNITTLVTGLWDIGRGDLQEGWSRSFQHYLDKFQQLLQVDVNMIIFGDEELEKFVLNNRRSENTQFVRRDLSWFKNNDFYDKIQKIRTNPDWYNQVGWLTESTQAKLEMYNPLVMSKIYLLHDAKILDKFDSEYMFWIDAGLTNTIHPGYFTHDKVLDKLPKLIKNFHFVCFPYDANSEIHGFKYQELCELAGKPVNMVARAGFFGGKKDTISEINSIYYGLMNDTLSQGLMGTEESLFTIMTYKYPNLISYSEIEGNGLMGKFFEDLKDMTVEVKSEVSKDVVVNKLDTSKVGLYVITFNSPKQLEVLIQSMLDYDKDFVEKPKKFLLDNSTDLTTTPRYIELCEQYGFEHIKKDNIGIVGGRVFVAEHFDETDLDCYWWFEDDMAFYPKKGEVCRNGFPRFVDNLYQKSLDILSKENFDFLKLNFSEFFGDNSVQWSWYNVPQDFRQKHWPNNPKLPVQGLDPNSPKTKFNEIHIHKGLPYVTGEVYLSNWPIVLSREGNYRCYLETKWSHPYEQTLMSYSYQETVKGKINPGLLLLTPTEHNRFEHYDGSLRKES
jgi:O-methyltransferase